ncbi:MAG: VWA domain-containing protein [Alsobacter sp.]
MASLHDPWWLLLLPAPWLLARWLPRLGTQVAGVPVPGRLADVLLRDMSGAGPGVPWLQLLLWGALVLALADPRWTRLETAPTATGRDVILAVDLSGSMGAADVLRDGRRVPRLEAVKAAAADFVRIRAGDRIGLLFFADEAYLAAAPSFDTAALAHLLGEAEVGLAGRGTAIGDALGLALKRLQPSTARERSVVLLSDGVNNAGRVEPLEAAALAARMGVVVHAVALDTGSGEGASRESFGVANPARDVDPDALGAIAAATGGRFFKAATGEELDAAYGALAQDMAAALPAPPVFVWTSLAWLPLVLAYAASLALLVRREAAA